MLTDPRFDALIHAAVHSVVRGEPTTVCAGWTEPRHPLVVLKIGDVAMRVSHGVCGECATQLKETA